MRPRLLASALALVLALTLTACTSENDAPVERVVFMQTAWP